MSSCAWDKNASGGILILIHSVCIDVICNTGLRDVNESFLKIKNINNRTTSLPN